MLRTCRWLAKTMTSVPTIITDRGVSGIHRRQQQSSLDTESGAKSWSVPFFLFPQSSLLHRVPPHFGFILLAPWQAGTTASTHFASIRSQEKRSRQANRRTPPPQATFGWSLSRTLCGIWAYTVERWTCSDIKWPSFMWQLVPHRTFIHRIAWALM